jgi:hypothetical protein
MKVKLVLACLVLLTISCVVVLAVAQVSSAQLVGESSGDMDTAHIDTNLVTIYSNLGPPRDKYICCNNSSDSNWLVLGPDSYWGASENVAMPFTTGKASATVTEIQIALLWDGYGTNNAEVVLASSAPSGAPGKPLASWDVQHMPTEGTCCTLVTVKSNPGVMLKANTQYFVVAKTDSKSTTAYVAWNNTYNLVRGPFYYDEAGAGWTPYDSYLSAFAVYGK